MARGRAGRRRSVLLLCAFLLAAACGDPARDRYERAEKELLAQRMETALSGFRAVAREHPQSRYAPAALLRQGDLFGAYYRNFPAALEAYGSLVFNYPRVSEVPLALLRSAEIHLLQYLDAAAAADVLERIRKEYPRFERMDEVLFLLAHARAAAGDVDRQIAVLSELVERHPRSSRAVEGAVGAGPRLPGAAPVRRRGTGIPQAPLPGGGPPVGGPGPLGSGAVARGEGGPSGGDRAVRGAPERLGRPGVHRGEDRTVEGALRGAGAAAGRGEPVTGSRNESIAVVGAGSWGTAFAVMLAERYDDVALWAHEAEVRDSIRRAPGEPRRSSPASRSRRRSGRRTTSPRRFPGSPWWPSRCLPTTCAASRRGLRPPCPATPASSPCPRGWRTGRCGG